VRSRLLRCGISELMSKDKDFESVTRARIVSPTRPFPPDDLQYGAKGHCRRNTKVITNTIARSKNW
jgi:hypothetical protein